MFAAGQDTEPHRAFLDLEPLTRCVFKYDSYVLPVNPIKTRLQDTIHNRETLTLGILQL